MLPPRPLQLMGEVCETKLLSLHEACWLLAVFQVLLQALTSQTRGKGKGMFAF